MSVQEEALVAGSDSFWEVDCFKRTVKRTEDGMQMCGEIMKMIQERAEIEKEYAKRLKGWSKRWIESIDKGPEYGTNKGTLKGSLDEADRLADVHLSIKDKLLNEVQTSVKDWRNDNYKKQMVGGCKEAKTFEDDFKKAQKPWAKKLMKVVKCKKDYHMACKLEKTATNQENNARNSSEMSADQVKKFQEKVEKCRKDVELTKVKYEESLAELNNYNAKYVEDMTEVYNRTQEFEDKRLQHFKKILYSLHSCLDLTQNTALPEIYSQFRRTIEQSDSSKDLKWWSLNNGVDMPMAWPTFEEYSTEFHSISRKEKGRSVHLGDGGVTLTAIQRSEIQPSAESHSRLGGVEYRAYGGNGVSSKASMELRTNNHASDSRPTSALVQSGTSQNPFGEDEWEEYENTALQDDVTGGGAAAGAGGNRNVDGGGGVRVKALYNYDGQEGDELTFKAGDVFLKIKDRDDQGWCTGCKDGKTGLYPDNYVEPI